VAARLYGPAFSSGQRRLAKSAVFAKLYGASAKKLATQTGVTEVVARQTMGTLDRAYPRLARWSKRTIDRAKFHGGTMTTPSGRRLPVDRGHEFRHGDRLLLPVHDELLLQCDEQVAEEFGMIIADIMAAHLGDVPLIAEATVCGPSWGHAYQPAEAVHA
jgi:DNA polymerase-1